MKYHVKIIFIFLLIVSLFVTGIKYWIVPKIETYRQDQVVDMLIDGCIPGEKINSYFRQEDVIVSTYYCVSGTKAMIINHYNQNFMQYLDTVLASRNKEK